jgi:hypothetical protein
VDDEQWPRLGCLVGQRRRRPRRGSTELAVVAVEADSGGDGRVDVLEARLVFRFVGGERSHHGELRTN